LILTSTYPGVFLGLEWVWASNVISTVDVGQRPSVLAFNPSNDNIYVANTNSNDVSVIESSTNAVISTVEVGDGPSVLAFNPSNDNIYVTNPVSDDVSVIQRTTSS
jgi:YVTN family beta-propeller protein